jgi:TRAP-type C4-dicarboxylate transport system permease small subunit
MRVSRAVLDTILTAEKIIVFGSFVAMLAAVSADVIGREVFGQGIFGSVKFAVYALILCAMAGFGIATASGSHLRPRFLDRLTSGAVEIPARRIGRIASAAILLGLAWGAWQMIAFSRSINERDITLGWLVWPMQLALPIGFGLSALRHLIYAAQPQLMPKEQEFQE